MVIYRRKYSSKKKKRSSKRKSSKKQRKKSSKNHQYKKKGGSVLGKGNFGCVISPNISCPNFSIVDSDKYVSKLVKPDLFIKDDFDIINALNIKNIDGYDKHLAIPIHKCHSTDININNVSQNSILDVKNCGIYDNNVFNIIQMKGGITFSKFRTDNPDLLLQDLLPYYCAMFEAIIFLHNNGICHRDLKDDNILVDKSSLKLIDFGYAAPINHKLYSIDGNRGLYNELYNVEGNKGLYNEMFIIFDKDFFNLGYLYWPIEINIFSNWSILEDKYELTEISKSIADKYFDMYIKSWLVDTIVVDHRSNNYVHIKEMFKNRYYENIDFINDTIYIINNETDKKLKQQYMFNYCYNVNANIDIFQLGIIILTDLLKIKNKSISDNKLIDELIIYLIEEVLTEVHINKPNINNIYTQFKNICKKHNITDDILVNINDNISDI
jgi:serine/threonine protein kinase